jgi:hypothetical protein
VRVLVRRQSQSPHHFFEADIPVAPRHVCDLDLDARGCLRQALAHVHVIEHEPKVGLEIADIFGVLRVEKWRSASVSRRCIQREEKRKMQRRRALVREYV